MKKIKILAILIVVLMACYLFAQPPPIGPLIMRFLDLTDVDEATYVGAAGKYTRVNAAEKALEFGVPAGAGDLLADGTVPLTANWDVGNFDITLKALTGDGTIEGATLTEGGTGVYNITESDAVYEPIVTEGSLANDTIIEADLKSTNAPTDNWLLSFDLASLGFTWVAGGGGAGDLLADGTIPLTANWDVGAFTITALRFVSDQATGTAPFTVASTTEVANLKAATATMATVATTVTITDNENTAENNPLVFVENGDLDGGNLGLESDGDAYYTPSTGVITAIGFVGALTGNVTGNADTVTNGAYTTNNLSVFAATTSAQLYGVLSDETGSAAGTPLAVFNNNPVLTGATLAGILADNDDMVFEVDADNNGANKFSFTDGASTEIAALTEGGAWQIDGSLTIGANADVDYTITFDGDTSDGILNYDEDNADFEFNQDIVSTGNVEGATVTQNGQTMYDADDVPGGSLGGTWATPTIDDLFIKLGGDTVTAGTYDFTAATLPMPKRTSNDDRYFAFNMISPNLVYDVDTQFLIEPNLPAAITITEVTVSCDADPATELDWDLKWADAFIGLGGATLVVAIDTTNGAADIDAGFNDATVAAGKCLYVEFAADPDAGITQVMVKIRYDYD